MQPNKPNTVILWEGISRIDGRTPVVCLLTGLTRKSRNSKTGGMLQTYILRADDVSPVEAVQTRQDVGMCGACKHRKNKQTGKRSCYVNVGHAPLALWRAFKRGLPSLPLTTVARLVSGRVIRFGAYGDPAAVPLLVWSTLAQNAAGYTGYTHQWRNVKFAGLSAFCQASCETLGDVAAARARGFTGAFLVVPCGDDIPAGAVHCPASVERGKLTTCAECRACNGAGGALVAIMAHGAGRGSYQPRRQPLPTLTLRA